MTTNHTGFANINNLALVRAAVEKLTSRNQAIPGLGAIFAPPGSGKTTALLAVANPTRAYYVQMLSVWGRKTLLQKICFEMDISTKAPTKKGSGRDMTIPELVDAISAELAASGRPLMIDEFDHCLKSDGMVELVRDIYESAQATIILSGEEHLLTKLQRWPRFCDRISTRIPLQPATLADARALAQIYCSVPCADDFLDYLVKQAKGSVRIISINLTNAGEDALLEGWTKIDMATWGDRKVYETALRHTGSKGGK